MLDEYKLEVCNLVKKTKYIGKQVLGLVQSREKRLRPLFGKPKTNAFVADGGRGGGGKMDGGAVVGSLERATAVKEDARESVTCWRCKAMGHYRDSCTVKACDRCGGKGYDSSKSGSPVDSMSALLVAERYGEEFAVEIAAFSWNNGNSIPMAEARPWALPS